MMFLPDRALRWVLSVVEPGSRVVAAQQIALGGWHVNHALDVVAPDGRVRGLVLRRWARPGWQADYPDYTVEREMRVLSLLAQKVIPAPHVVAADPDGIGCDVPALLLTRLPGHPPGSSEYSRDDFTDQLAGMLAQIHTVQLPDPPFPSLRLYYDRPHATLPDWLPRTRVWTAAVAAVREPPPATVDVMLHRDYHPENTLWTDGRLSGVVDWTQASTGPAGFDLGHMRWNLVADHGQAIADRFLADYQAVTRHDLECQPNWDLVALLDLLLCSDEPGDITPNDLHTFEQYTQTLLERIGR
jgi:aminoglycoside phosphotransferase (APT) family kinase protein